MDGDGVNGWMTWRSDVLYALEDLDLRRNSDACSEGCRPYLMCCVVPEKTNSRVRRDRRNRSDRSSTGARRMIY